MKETWGPPWHHDRRTGRFMPREGFPHRQSRHFELPGAFFAGLIQVVSARHFGPLAWQSYLLLLAGPVLLLWRRRFPIPVFVLCAAAAIAYGVQTAPRWTSAVAAGVALFAVARQGLNRAAIGLGAGAYTAYLAIAWFHHRPSLGEAVTLGLGLAFLVFLGGVAKFRSEQIAEMIKVRAERAKAAEEQEKRQASEERLRIARELHDVLGHHLSLINVQAGVGLHLMDSRPEQAREALTAIKTASAEALREVRSVLGVLRTEDEAAPRQPALGLSRLADLTADAGIPIKTAIDGTPRELPAEVDRAAYRIVQEALTNVRKHAGPAASATVSVSYLPTALHLAIRNDGEVAAGASAGSGVTGMRERAQSLGGRLEAGPVEGGYLVSVLLPTQGDST